MKMLNRNTFCLLLVAISLLLMNGCTKRINTPILEDDGTLVYPSKDENGISSKITFCRKVDKKTGEKIGEGTVFTANEKRSIRAYVDLENLFLENNRDLMFHFDWIGPDGETFYLKKYILSPNDSISTISSSVSSSPETRPPGEYKLRIFLFRELFAEKNFEVLPPFQLLTNTDEKLKADIRLYRKKSKKTGNLIGEGVSFKMKNKRKVRALVNLDDRFVYGKQELLLKLDWVGPDTNSFYQKKIELYPDDSTSSFKTSISITPGKREPGNYYFRVYLYDELISEQGFELYE